MEAWMIGKSRSTAIGVMRALLEPLQKHWGALDAFQHDGLEVLASEGGGLLYDEKNAQSHLEQIYRQVMRARASYFRPIANPSQIELMYKQLEQGAASSPSPFQQGVFWLASRVQHTAAEFLNNAKGEAQLAKVLEELPNHRNQLAKTLSNPDGLTLDRIESLLVTVSAIILSEAVSRFELHALAGRMVEIGREAGRKLPEMGGGGYEEPPESGTTDFLIALIAEPVREGELNDAQVRYTRFSDEEKQRRYNEFRRHLVSIIGTVAPYAPLGVDLFCQAIESLLYPYPQQMEFIRSFARTLHTNGSQSKLFDEIQTPQAIEQRYETLLQSRRGNPLILEMARAFAMHAFRDAQRESRQSFMREIELSKEFGWPASMDELLSQLD